MKIICEKKTENNNEIIYVKLLDDYGMELQFECNCNTLLKTNQQIFNYLVNRKYYNDFEEIAKTYANSVIDFFKIRKPLNIVMSIFTIMCENLTDKINVDF